MKEERRVRSAERKFMRRFLRLLPSALAFRAVNRDPVVHLRIRLDPSMKTPANDDETLLMLYH